MILKPGEIRCITNNKVSDDSLTYIDFADDNHIREIMELYSVPSVFIHLGWGAVYKPQSDIHLTTNISNGKNLIRELYNRVFAKHISAVLFS